jgi:hypothetical protein
MKRKKAAYRKQKFKQNPKVRFEYYMDVRTVLALRLAAKAQDINDSKLVEKILDEHYSEIF